MEVHQKHGKVAQNIHGASRNYRYVWDVSGPTYTLSLRGIWVQQVAAQASFFVEARSLVRDAPTWNKRSSELLVVTHGAFCELRRGIR